MKYVAQVAVSRLENGMIQMEIAVDENNLGLFEMLKEIELFRHPKDPLRPPQKARVVVQSVTFIEEVL